LNKWGNKNGDYVFDVLTDEMDEERKVKVIEQRIKQVNKYMKRLADRSKINKP